MVPSSSDSRAIALPPLWQLAGWIRAAEDGAGRRVGTLLLFWVALAAQSGTVVLTWPLWQLRSEPPNLPAVDFLHLSFGPLVVVSLVLAFLWPRAGVMVHGLVIVVACAADQFRMQPQFLMLWVLMVGCLSERGAWLARWVLISMWLWAGLHKFISPEWFGPVSWRLLARSGYDADRWFRVFGVLVAGGEVALGLLAIFGPRRVAAVGCVLVHMGIFLFLSPGQLNWNESVWPWNLATALVGGWLFWTAPRRRPRGAIEWIAAALLMMFPAGYYLGFIDAHLVYILYSKHMPKGRIIEADEHARMITGWGKLRVPFPDAHRLFIDYFAAVGRPGEKLHIDEPRRTLFDRYFLMQPDRTVIEIDRAEFLRGPERSGEVIVARGIEPDERGAAFWLERDGALLTHGTHGNVTRAVLFGEQYTDLHLEYLGGLPNLEWVELNATSITNAGLRRLAGLAHLEYLYLNSTAVTDAGLVHLAGHIHLKHLYLASTQITDDGLAHLATLTDLEELDLSATRLTDAGLLHLTTLKRLDALLLDDTKVTDQGVARLQAALPGTEIYRAAE